MLKQILLVIGVLAGSAVSSLANIAFIVPPNAPAVTDWGPDTPVNLGMVFSPTTNISVTGLGAYYQGAGSYTPCHSEVVDLFQNSK